MGGVLTPTNPPRYATVHGELFESDIEVFAAYLFSPPGMPAWQAVFYRCFKVFFYFLVVDLGALSSQELLDRFSPNIRIGRAM